VLLIRELKVYVMKITLFRTSSSDFEKDAPILMLYLFFKATVPGSLASGTRGSAQQTWGNWLEANPQQMQENRNSG